MLKLIASDMDGTLLPYGQRELPEKLFDLIHALRERGILFAPASGRPYRALRQFFAPVADELCFLCENGGQVYGPGREGEAPLLSVTAFPKETAVALARDMARLPFCETLISGRSRGYILSGDRPTKDQLRAWSKGLPDEVDDPSEIGEEIIKISAFCPDGVEATAAALGARWGDYNMAQAAPKWLDFTVANKGKGLAALCHALGVDLSETAAFGDNWNDAAMLEVAGEAYLMSSAHPDLRRRFPRQCDSVLAELERILAERG